MTKKLISLLASSGIHLNDIELCLCCFGKHVESLNWHELALFEGESELLLMAPDLELIFI